MDPTRYSPELPGTIAHLLQSVRAKGLEGLIAERRDTRDEPGSAQDAWPPPIHKRPFQKDSDLLQTGPSSGGRDSASRFRPACQKPEPQPTTPDRTPVCRQFIGLEPAAIVPLSRTGPFLASVTAPVPTRVAGDPAPATRCAKGTRDQQPQTTDFGRGSGQLAPHPLLRIKTCISVGPLA
jgi:hypothetical protein